MRRPSTRIRSVSLRVPFEDASVEPGQADRVDALPLQLLDPHLVELAAVHHLEDLERAAIGAAADVTGLAGHELRRVAERLGHRIGRLRAAVHEQQLGPLRPQRHDVRHDGVDIERRAAADLDDDHPGTVTYGPQRHRDAEKIWILNEKRKRIALLCVSASLRLVDSDIS